MAIELPMPNAAMAMDAAAVEPVRVEAATVKKWSMEAAMEATEAPAMEAPLAEVPLAIMTAVEAMMRRGGGVLHAQRVDRSLRKRGLSLDVRAHRAAADGPKRRGHGEGRCEFVDG